MQSNCYLVDKCILWVTEPLNMDELMFEYAINESATYWMGLLLHIFFRWSLKSYTGCQMSRLH